MYLSILTVFFLAVYQVQLLPLNIRSDIVRQTGMYNYMYNTCLPSKNDPTKFHLQMMMWFDANFCHLCQNLLSIVKLFLINEQQQIQGWICK